MRKFLFKLILPSVFLLAGLIASSLFGRNLFQPGYILEHEKELGTSQPGPHDGGGKTTAYNFFSTAVNSKLVFRKRILHPGSAIGYHLQNEDEIYYILSGTGEMKMNGKTFTVEAGDAILTLPGSSHSLTPTGKDDLTIIINYEKK